MGPLTPSEADAVVRRLTNDQIQVEIDEVHVHLVHTATREKVRLLPYQMTEEGVVRALADFGWRSD